MKLRIASYNIRHGHDAGSDMSLLASDICSVKADVVGLQEVDIGTARVHGRNTLAELAEAMGFVHYRFCRAIDYMGGQYGTAILSRYPIESFKIIPLPCDGTREARSVGHAVIDADGMRVDFFNTHLSVESTAARLPQFDALAALTKHHPGWILTGDFNTANLDCFSVFRNASMANPNRFATFPESGEGIDNVVCNAPWNVTDTGILQNHHSDHVLLWAELTR